MMRLLSASGTHSQVQIRGPTACCPVGDAAGFRVVAVQESTTAITAAVTVRAVPTYRLALRLVPPIVPLGRSNRSNYILYLSRLSESNRRPVHYE
jgi:hypothetical protein